MALGKVRSLWMNGEENLIERQSPNRILQQKKALSDGSGPNIR